MKNAIIALTVLLLSALTVSSEVLMTFPKAQCSDRLDFEARTAFRVWPNELQDDLAQVDGPWGKALCVTPSTGNVTIYLSMKLPSVGPGNLLVEFDYRQQGNLHASFQANFNLEGKGNGSAGKIKTPVEDSSEWQTFRQTISVPEGTAALQYTLNIEGKGEMLIDNFSIAYAPDSISVPIAKAVDFYAPASNPCWNPKTPFYGFFNSVEDAITPVQLQMAADNDGLYLLFRNFMNPETVRQQATEFDANVWQDDANEIVIFDEDRGIGWQFIANARGTQQDCVLKQRVPGDPWNADVEWNGEWQAQGALFEEGFETRFYIPWKTLGINPAETSSLGFHACGDYTAIKEYPGWNAYQGTRFDVGKYGTIALHDGMLTLTRNRDLKKLSYAIERQNPKFQELLETGVKGGYEFDVWSMGINRSDFPKAVMSKTSDNDFTNWQNELLRAWAAAGIGGPSWPWVCNYGRERMEKRFQENGLKFPFFICNSDVGRAARRNGAKFIDPRNDFTCDSVDPHFVDAVENFIRSQQKGANFDFMSRSTKFVLGLDEPTNSPGQCYNPVFNPNAIDEIRALSEKICAEYGFGKYGVPFLEDVSDTDMPFARIAFYRWWNHELLDALLRFRKAANEVLPGVAMNLFDDNNTAGQSVIDAALVNGYADLTSCDPYPTSTNASYGMARALYHVGYSCRVLKDLVPSARLILMPQCFIYHGGHGDVAAMGEWLSQGLKNGAENFMWFCTDAVHEIFPDYAGMLELSAMVRDMDRVKRPTETKTLVWYSNFDKWARNDSATHAQYSLYAMLAETIGSNFRFISDTTLTKGDVALENYSLMYVPRMSYTTPEIAEKLAQWVEQGGTLVVFDPDFLRWNIDGSANALRQKLTGQPADLTVKTEQNASLRWNDNTLALAKIANAPSLPGTRFETYTIQPDGNDQIVMTYADDTPAAILRTVGKGKVLYFAAQPFAGSDLALDFGHWTDFFREQAQNVDEPIDLPIRDFQLPPPPKTVNLKRMIF